MMTICTMGFAQKSAQEFFETLRHAGVELLVDIRLNNRSQLAGFTKGTDLCYFLKNLCGIDYIHCQEFAPSKELLSGYQKKEISWEGYTAQFTDIMERRGAYRRFTQRFADYGTVCLLCSEPTPERCHRRLLAELIAQASPGEVEIKHL